MIKSRRGKNQACFLEKRQILEVRVLQPSEEKFDPQFMPLPPPSLSSKAIVCADLGEGGITVKTRVTQTMTQRPILSATYLSL